MIVVLSFISVNITIQEAYVKEVCSRKENMLLLSKADLLTPYQRYWNVLMMTVWCTHRCCREVWANYFDKEGLSYAFWSAHLEASKVDLRPSSDDKENCCITSGDDNQQEEEQSKEDDIDDVLPQAIVSGFVLEDECATMTTDHEPSSEVHQLTDDNNVTVDTDDASASHDEKPAESVAIATQPKSQTAIIDDVVNSPSSHQEEETRLSHTNEESKHNHSMLLTVNNVPVDSSQHRDVTHSEVDTKNEGSSSDTTLATNPRANLLTSDELLDLFRSLCSSKVQRKAGEPIIVGMVGYPNVGKSSTINTLIQGKKVPVSATPGRTKHFQVSDPLIYREI